jgi:superfamily II DNA or RNA helicase
MIATARDITLRPYQDEAVSATLEAWHRSDSTLIVMPTGTGKTVVLAKIAEHRLPSGRVLLLAHREELIFQGAKKIRAVTGEVPDIEMAEHRARHDIWGKSKIVVSSVQTLSKPHRLERFDPSEFATVIVDEAHHSVASSYLTVINHFRKGGVKLLGVTATPDRADEEALGKVFESVAFEYDLPGAIHDGWLVPILHRAVWVEGLDYSSIRTTAGDLNGKDLAEVLEYEDNLHRIAAPAIDIIGERKALVFAASVVQADRICEIFNRHRPGSSAFIHGKTNKEDRRNVLKQYANGDVQILVNVGVATEGFDEPTIKVVVLARPTKSRALYAQMVGRGTRPLNGVVDGLDSAQERRDSIAASDKTACEIVDFVGNAGKHQLVHVADILAGNYDDIVVGRAKHLIQKAGRPMDVAEALEEAAKELAERRRKEAASRAALTVKAQYKTSPMQNVFDVLGMQPWRERAWHKGRAPSEKMNAMLERNGIPTEGVTFTQAKQLIGEIFNRREKGLCSYKQAKLLERYGYDGNVPFAQAKQVIDGLAKNGWKRK